MNYPYSNNAVMYPRQVRRRPNQAAMMNPIYSRPPLEKIEISPEFMNQVSAEVFKSQALANMLTKNPLRYGMSISDYGPERDASPYDDVRNSQKTPRSTPGRFLENR